MKVEDVLWWTWAGPFLCCVLFALIVGLFWWRQRYPIALVLRVFAGAWLTVVMADRVITAAMILNSATGTWLEAWEMVIPAHLFNFLSLAGTMSPAFLAYWISEKLE